MDAFIIRKRPRSNDQRERAQVDHAARDQSISPPPKRNAIRAEDAIGKEVIDLTDSNGQSKAVDSTSSQAKQTPSHVIPSPVQLNFVRDLPATNNVDTIKLSDILGNPMIEECWLFNYLFEMDFVM